MIEMEPGDPIPAESPWDVVTDSPDQTQALARRFAGTLASGANLLLYGDMGAGKTCFVQGLADGMGLDPGRVHSPTFIMVNRYDGAQRLYHADLYRLGPGESFADLALEDLFTSPHATVVEWAERLPDVARPEPRWEIRFIHAGGERRRLRFAHVPTGE